MLAKIFPQKNKAVRPFSPEFLGEMKLLLLDEKKRLEEELTTFAKRNKHGEGNFDAKFSEYGDETDANTQEIEEYTVNKPLEMTLENALRDVVKALASVEAGKYGECKYCHKQIEEKRLRARPTSSSCVSCKKTITNET